jgi:hypothetical protein
MRLSELLLDHGHYLAAARSDGWGRPSETQQALEMAETRAFESLGAGPTKQRDGDAGVCLDHWGSDRRLAVFLFAPPYAAHFRVLGYAPMQMALWPVTD